MDFSIRTIFTCSILLCLLYLFYFSNTFLVDEKQRIIQQHSSYKASALQLASLLEPARAQTRHRQRQQRWLQRATPVRRLPDALIIGVKKCGTRALLEFLRLHPDVRAAGSEVHFFDRFYHKGYEWYRERMPPTLPGQLVMEKTPGYWATRAAPRRVRSMGPAVRLLAVVRDPVTRALSDYAQSASKRPLPPFERLAFSNSSVWGAGGVSGGWAALRLGVYWAALRRWLRHVPRARLLLLSGERLVADPAGEMARVQDFLGLKRVITEKHFYFNSSKGFPCLVKGAGGGRGGGGAGGCLGASKGRAHPRLAPATLQALRDYYRPHNEKFYKLSGINFGWP